MVAGVGFEPHDLRVMSPTSYQAALPRDIKFLPVGVGDRGRTGTILSYHGILSPGRLPVPPHRQASTDFFASLRSAYVIISHFVLLVKPFRKIIDLFYFSLMGLIPLYTFLTILFFYFTFYVKWGCHFQRQPQNTYFSSSIYSDISIFASSAGDILPLVFSK